jgi:hypothetical protein
MSSTTLFGSVISFLTQHSIFMNIAPFERQFKNLVTGASVCRTTVFNFPFSGRYPRGSAPSGCMLTAFHVARFKDFYHLNGTFS